MRSFVIAASLLLTVIPVVASAAATTTAASVKSTGPVPVSDFVDYGRREGEFASAVVVDVKTGKVLYGYEQNKVWPAASLTKLMGALVFTDTKPKWNAMVSILRQDEVGGGRLRVTSGSKMRVVDLMYSSVAASANNAATALARISGYGMKGFVRAMNRKAAGYGLKNTRFVDPSGMDPGNVTTAREMSVLAQRAFSRPEILRAAVTPTHRFVILNTGFVKDIKTTNLFLRDVVPADDIKVTGGKTGFLYESKHNLVVRLQPDEKTPEKSVMVVVFGADTAENSFRTAKSLANWAWKEYTWSP